MKDIHSHILPSIDDGSESMEESMEIIKKAIANGYTDIILTPHYRKIQNYTACNKKKKELFALLQAEIKKESLSINLYLGNEITVDDDFFYYLDTNQLFSLNNSKYFLLELPFYGRLSYLEDFFTTMLEYGYIPIIAHPERYEDYKNLDEFSSWINKGILFQGNIETLYGKYGEKAKNKLETMIKKHMVHFLGSDIHHEGQTTYEKDTISLLETLTGSMDMALDLVDRNIECVIKNKEIKPYKIIEEKKGLKVFKVLNR